MNVLSRLTLRNLMLNRKRTIVTIIGVILSGAMICGVATLVASFQDMLIRSAEVSDGKHHASFDDVPYANSKMIAEHAFTKTAMLSKDIGFARLEGNKFESKPYLHIKSFDAAAFAHFPVTLTEGRFPAQPGEIAVSEETFYTGGVKFNVGDTLTVPVGRRIDQGVELASQELSETETLETDDVYTFTVTGIIEQPRFESWQLPGHTAIAFLDDSSLAPDDPVQVSIVATKPGKIFEMAPKLAELAGAQNVKYNNELLRWMGVTNNSQIANMFETIGLIIISLVVVGSVSVIYNAFAISVSERKKQFGMLSSVGATRRQIRRMVLLEGLYLGVIGIPIGILSGIGGIAVTLQAVNRLMEDAMFGADASMRLVISPDTVWISVLFIALTILLSAWIPAVRASRISPIEAIRLTTDIQIKGKRLRTAKLTRRLFGIEGELALKNLKRHRRRYRATVFSLFISIVLYVSFSSFMTYGFASSNMYYEDSGYDFMVQKQQIKPEEQRELYGQIAKLGAVERYATLRSVRVNAVGLERSQFGSYIEQRYLDNGESIGMDYRSQQGGYRIGVSITAVGEAEFAHYTEQLGLDRTALDDPEQLRGILVNRNKARAPVMAEFAPLNVKPGDQLHLAVFDTALTIEAVTDTTPLGIAPADFEYVHVIVSEAGYDALLAQMRSRLSVEDAAVTHGFELANLVLNVKEGTDRRAFAEQIRALDAGLYPGAYLFLMDRVMNQKETENTKTVISIFLYGFVSLITLIGVTNIFNTISTNVALRRREFAMLKSVGLTPAGFNRMINFESIFYGLRALLYGLPVSALVSLWMYHGIGNVFDFAFVLPWKEIAICIAGVFVIVFATMMHASAKLKKENIIDALKEENL